jgi:GNAT superfamily N-acetyltransferase
MVERAYPAFMNHDVIANRCFPLMYDMYPQWQVLAVDDDRPVGFFNSVPLPFAGTDDELPDEGWDWAIDLATRHPVADPRVACGIQVVVDPNLHGRGYSRALLAQMKATARTMGCDRLYVPLRPTRKAEYPTESMAVFAGRTLDDGRPFDPWQRVHASAGATILHPCERAMVIEGSVSDWQRWTGLTFSVDGEVLVPGALAPVVVDLAADRITYVEPNLWLRHDI